MKLWLNFSGGTEKAVPASETRERVVRPDQDYHSLDLEVKAVLAQRGYAVAVLKRGSRRLSCRCCEG